MAIRFGIVITAIAMLLFFQNCAKSPGASSSDSPTAEKVVVTDGIKLDSKTFFIAHDPALGSDVDTLMQMGLKLDVETGVLEYLGNRGTADGQLRAGDKFCLNEGERFELQELVRQDAVCRAMNPLKSDQVCAMAMKPGYALYGSESQSLSEVGSASCLKGADVDFCEGQGAKVEALLKSVQAGLSDRACR